MLYNTNVPFKLMRQYRNYTDKDFIDAWTTSLSIRQVLEKIGLKAAGGNYACARRKAEHLGLTRDHMKGQSWNKGRKFGPKRTIEEMCASRNTQSHALKGRLISEGYKEHKCEVCGITEWNGRPTPIELDHIDGDHSNNLLYNLRIICPNCHAQTNNYRGKNKGGVQ